MDKISWDEYFFKLAEDVAKRSTCLRAQVGSVAVRDNRIIATGYNGSPSGRVECLTLDYCYRDREGIPSGTKLEACHACGAHSESNVIAMAARYGIPVDGAEIYLCGHDVICAWCQSILLNSGIAKVHLKNRKGEIKTFIPKIDFIKHPFLPSE